jgi:2-methylcitrate dehydratase PrpD
MDAMTPLLEFGLRTRPEDLPESVVERTRMAILDTLAATLGGYRGESVQELGALVAHWGGTPEATLLATGQKLPLPLAVLGNGTAARALDLDDVHEQNTCHVNVTTVPVALALAEARGPVGGRELIAAVAVGAELICRLSAAPRIGFSETGHSMSYACGFFGATLVASRLMRLPLAVAQHAMGIAYARIAGNQQGFLAGAMTVRLMQGIAAEGGVVSALMAERGLTGSRDVLEGRFGYYPVFHRGVYEPADLTAELGDRWLLEDVSLKPVYPCCKFIHGPIDALRAALARCGAAVDDIAGIRFKVTNREVHDLVCAPRERKWNPGTVTDAQFSLPFMTAWAAVHGGIGFRPLAAESLADPQVRALMQRIEVDVEMDAQGEGRGRFPMPGIVTVTERSGRRTESVVEYVKGHPKNPMTFDDVAAKLDECAAYGHPGWKHRERLVGLVRHLERCPDVAEIARLCART